MGLCNRTAYVSNETDNGQLKILHKTNVTKDSVIPFTLNRQKNKVQDMFELTKKNVSFSLVQQYKQPQTLPY